MWAGCCLIVSGCAAASSPLGPQPAVSSSPSAQTTATADSETLANSPTSESPSPSATPARENVPIDWDTGRGTPEQPEPDPSPVGWYEAAFGGSASDQGRVLYLSFDDGPGTSTPEVLDLLRQYNAKATFFVIGSAAASQPTMVEAIRADGHALGNHTWNHPDLVGLSESAVAGELQDTGAVAGTGPCMRPPYGSIDRRAGGVSESLGLQPIMWTAQAFDWKSTATPEQITQDLKERTQPGAVVLLHDGGGSRANTVAALAQLLPFWTSQGYELKAVPACQPDDAP